MFGNSSQKIMIMCILLLATTLSLAVGQEITTADCGSLKACLKSPSSCSNSADCDFLITYKRKSSNDAIMDFEVSSKNGNGYIALGFNPSNQMAGTTGEICQINGGMNELKGFDAPTKTKPALQAPASDTTMTSLGVTNGALICKFSRPLSPTGYQKSLLSPINVIIATGAVSNGLPAYHGVFKNSFGSVDLSAFVVATTAAATTSSSSLTSKKASTVSTSTQTPSMTSTSAPTSTVDISSCGKTKGCFKLPSNCTTSDTCNFVVTWKPKQSDGKVDIEIKGTGKAWVSFGLNKETPGMTAAYGELCYTDGLSSELRAFYAHSQSRPTFSGSKPIGASMHSLIQDSQGITCRYTRTFNKTGNYSININEMFYFIVASGDSAINGRPSYHRSNRAASSSKFNISAEIKAGNDGKQLQYKFWALLGSLLVLLFMI